MVGGRIATTMGTPQIRHSVGGGGWANEAPHCQGELEEFRQVLGEVSFMGRAVMALCHVYSLSLWGAAKTPAHPCPAPCPTDGPKERMWE